MTKRAPLEADVNSLLVLVEDLTRRLKEVEDRLRDYAEGGPRPQLYIQHHRPKRRSP